MLPTINPPILLVLILPLAAGAQVRKCTIDGQIVYSDSQCGKAGAAVNTDANSLDTSGLREQAAKRSAKEAQIQAKEKADAAKAKRLVSADGPCPNMVGAAYETCLRDRIKKPAEKMAPRRYRPG